MSLLWLVWRALIAITLMLGYYVLGITLGGGLIGERLAADIVRVFLATPFAGGRHQARVAMIDALDHH